MFARQSYINLAVEAVLNGDLDLPVYVGEGVALRAEVVVRNILPQIIENLAARERYTPYPPLTVVRARLDEVVA